MRAHSTSTRSHTPQMHHHPPLPAVTAPMLPHLGLRSTACAASLPCCWAEQASGASPDASSTPGPSRSDHNTCTALSVVHDCAAAPAAWPASPAHTAGSDLLPSQAANKSLLFG